MSDAASKGIGDAGGERSELQALVRAIRVLETLAAAPSGDAGLSEIAQSVGISKAGALRALRTWESAGYVSKSADSRYRIGWKLFVLAQSRSFVQELRGAARPYLEKLGENSMETVLLGVRTGQQVTYIDRIEGRQRVRVSTDVGAQVPLYATASGKAILAYCAPAFVEELMATAISLAPNTVVTLAKMQTEIAKVRSRGYAISDGELTPDVGSVAAPIVTSIGSVEAAVSVAFPAAGASQARIKEFGELAVDAAGSVSAALGLADAARDYLGSEKGK